MKNFKKQKSFILWSEPMVKWFLAKSKICKLSPPLVVTFFVTVGMGCLVHANSVHEIRRASEKRRIMEEVEILGSINHSQIMRLYRGFADMEDSLNDEIVLLLEYLSGSSYFLCFLQAQYP